MSDEDDPFDLQHRACALDSWIIMRGLRVELCSRCEPLSKTPEWKGPMVLLPQTADRRECVACRAKTVDDLARLKADAVVFCRACVARAMSRRREVPLNYSAPQGPRAIGEQSRSHFFF